MRPITVTVGNMVTAASATAIRTATTVAAGDLVLNGAQALTGLETDRNLLFTFAGAEPGLRLTVEGASSTGQPVSETILGPAGAGTVLSNNLYRKVYRVASNQASVGAVSIGTSAIGTSRPIYLDPWAWTPIGVQATVAGTANWTLQVCATDGAFGSDPMVWVSAPDAALVGQAGNAVGQLAVPFAFARVLLNSGTGLVTATITQPGVVNR